MIAKRLLAAAAIACSLPASAATEPIDSGSPMFEKSGDILQWALPLAGLGMTLLLPDGDGKSGLTAAAAAAADPLGNASALNWPGPRLGGSLLHDFAVAFARMEVATYGLKYTINAERPNGRNGQSFPSGHTASAFMGAEFIRKHHGNAWGVPAHLTAAWVGYTRVDSHNHYWTDVAGGALVCALAAGLNRLLARRCALKPTSTMAERMNLMVSGLVALRKNMAAALPGRKLF